MSPMLVMSQEDCKAIVLQKGMLLEIYICSVTLQRTAVKWSLLLSLSAACIIQLTTQKAGVGSQFPVELVQLKYSVWEIKSEYSQFEQGYTA